MIARQRFEARPRSRLSNGNRAGGRERPTGVDDAERQALRDEGLDPDDPAVVAALDLVRWELSLNPQ